MISSRTALSLVVSAATDPAPSPLDHGIRIDAPTVVLDLDHDRLAGGAGAKHEANVPGGDASRREAFLRQFVHGSRRCRFRWSSGSIMRSTSSLSISVS